ncbi:hypothetical protein HPB49_021173 [Dermacentor silvarum]|uniref:Uncharacterized protein n=1 Tax=Dermacentor silvarum TaxID=543639 RepID=A0ACB8CMW5_DERSI|nr:hypothetical protein HPB49_021173 [Dermacentor silvarum]
MAAVVTSFRSSRKDVGDRKKKKPRSHDAAAYNTNAQQIRDRRRPFFIIGHMANTMEEVNAFLKDGANAVEVDTEFADNGTVLGTYHETFPCECFRVCGKREKIKTFLSHIRDITGTPSSPYAGKMILLFLDLKTSKLPASSKFTAGLTLAENLVHHLWYGGYDVGMNGDLKSIKRMYGKLGIRRHQWQGDGLMNCFRFLIPEHRLIEAIRQRDRPGGYIDKVYYWTVDLPPYIANAISEKRLRDMPNEGGKTVIQLSKSQIAKSKGPILSFVRADVETSKISLFQWLQMRKHDTIALIESDIMRICPTQYGDRRSAVGMKSTREA